MTKNVLAAKNFFIKKINGSKSDPYGLISHVTEAEKWARFMLKKYTSADAEVVLSAVWLHDVGHYPLPAKVDHAVRSEKIARVFLARQKMTKEKTNKILHCIRAHRCRDVMPETLEAKIVACVDSASHMTDNIYFSMAMEGRAEEALGKLARDYRDLSAFPEVKKKLSDLYKSWKTLLSVYNKVLLD